MGRAGVRGLAMTRRVNKRWNTRGFRASGKEAVETVFSYRQECLSRVLVNKPHTLLIHEFPTSSFSCLSSASTGDLLRERKGESQDHYSIPPQRRGSIALLFSLLRVSCLTMHVNKVL